MAQSSPFQRILVVLISSTVILPFAVAYNHITRRQLLIRQQHDNNNNNNNNNDNNEQPQQNKNDEGHIADSSAVPSSSLLLFSKEDEPEFLRPRHLESGELASAVRREDGEIIDPGTFFIGLPPELTERFQDYIRDSGILQIAEEVLYENPVVMDENRFFKLDDGTTWGIRPANVYVRSSGDMTFIDPADEWTYEVVLDMYRQNGFDKVLDTLAEKHGVDGLWIDGTSFVFVSHFEGDNLHTDLMGLEHSAFNILFPLVVPEAGGQLILADWEEDNYTGANFQFNQGVVVGGSSWHGTGNVDNRETREFRMALSVYLDDINEDNVAEFDDNTAAYPLGGDFDYLLAQAGRHWGRHAGLTSDKGRRPYHVEDEDPENCPNWVEDGRCMKDKETRNYCAKSCDVYMEDDIYYEKLGKLLNWPTEAAEES